MCRIAATNLCSSNLWIFNSPLKGNWNTITSHSIYTHLLLPSLNGLVLNKKIVFSNNSHLLSGRALRSMTWRELWSLGSPTKVQSRQSIKLTVAGLCRDCWAAIVSRAWKECSACTNDQIIFSDNNFNLRVQVEREEKEEGERIVFILSPFQPFSLLCFNIQQRDPMPKMSCGIELFL